MKSVQEIQNEKIKQWQQLLTPLNTEVEDYAVSFNKAVCESVHEKLLQLYPAYSAGRILLERKGGPASNTYIITYKGYLYSEISIIYDMKYPSREWKFFVYQPEGRKVKYVPGTLDSDEVSNTIVEIIDERIQNEKNFLDGKRASASNVTRMFLRSLK